MNLHRAIIFCVMFSLSGVIYSQIGLGVTGGLDLYQRYNNPDDGIAAPSAGSALLNIAIGPKLWIGGKQFSISAEAPVSIAPLGFSTGDYKGLGMLAVPVIGMLNFGKTSGFNKDGGLGFSIGGGLQYFKTELFGLTDEFSDQGVVREWERVYTVQVNLGFGISGFAGHFFARYGFSEDGGKPNSFNIGLQTDFNFLMTRNIDDPASSL